MSSRNRKYVYRIMMAVCGLLTALGIVRQEIIAAIMPVITAVLALADANVPDEGAGDGDAR